MIYTHSQMMHCYRNAPRYKEGLLIVQSADTMKELRVYALLMWLRRLCEAYEGLSFYLVVSTHKSSYRLIRTKLYITGKSGRPKNMVKGDSTKPHIHVLIISTKDDIPRKTIANYLLKRRKKSPYLHQAKTKSAWKDSLPVVSYMHSQADSEHYYGDFDFSYHLSPLYLLASYLLAGDYDNIFRLPSTSKPRCSGSSTILAVLSVLTLVKLYILSTWRERRYSWVEKLTTRPYWRLFSQDRRRLRLQKNST